MTTFTDVFGGSTLQAAQVAYAPIALTANLPTYWPAFATGTQQPLARIMEITSSSAGLAILLPDATLAGLGQDVFFNNKTANTVTVQDVSGNAIATVAAGQTRYIYLDDNSTANGVWQSVLFGVGSSSPDASQLAGYGIKAIGATLNQSSVTATISTNQTFGASDRSKLYVNTGAAITCTFPLTGSVGNDYFLELRNQGSGVMTLSPSGGELIDGSASIALQMNESCIVQAGTGAWYTVGRGRNTQFNFTQLLKTVTGGTTTLTLTEASNVVQTYSGTLTSNETLVLPAVVQVYYIANKCTGAFSFTIQSPTPGSTLVLSNNQNAVVFCDGINVINASTSIAGITSLLLAAGSAGSPSLGFVSSNNGLFAPSSTAMAVSAGGTEVMRWTGGQSLGAVGSQGAPAYSFNLYPTTGAYSPAANAYGISTNSALRLQIDSTGLVTPGANATQDLGSAALSWNNFYASVLRSVVATGTAPLVVASTTKVTNLNADLLDGADWASPPAIGSGTPANGTFADLTGRLKGFTEFVTTATGVSGAYNVDLSLGNIFDLTLTGNTTITFTNPPASGTLKSCTLILRQGGTGGYTLTVTNGKYTDGVVPVLSTAVGAIDMLSYFTVNAGASYFGMFAMANIS